MGAIDNAMVSKLINATAPVGTGGIPGTWTALGASAMKVKLTSTQSTASAAGTELTGTGYSAGGTALTTASTPSSAGGAVTLPAGAALSWTNGSAGAWSVDSFELVDSAGLRTWFGRFTGAPVNIAIGNTFRIEIGGISLSYA